MNENIEYIEHLTFNEEDDKRNKRRGFWFFGGRGAVMALGLAAVLAVAAVMATLTDAETAKNVFTLGNVNITLDADTNKGSETEDTLVEAGVPIHRTPTVTNVGELDAYVFLKVTVPEADIKGTAGVEQILSLKGIDASKWTNITAQVKDKDNNSFAPNTYVFAYGSSTTPTKLTATGTNKTASLYNAVVVDPEAESTKLSNLGEESFDVDLKAYAVQTNFHNEDGSVKNLSTIQLWDLVKTLG